MRPSIRDFGVAFRLSPKIASTTWKLQAKTAKMAKTWRTGPLSKSTSTSKLSQRADCLGSQKGSAGLVPPQSRQQRQGFARPSALLTSSPQQPATVRGCPVTIDASSTGSINLRLKLCAQWSDVAKVIDDFGDSLNASNVAYALFRLGCLYCFMSEQRKYALERSGMLDALLKRASDKIGSFCASDVTFALDGMARLRLQPETPVLDALAQKVAAEAANLLPSQVPLILWAFASLGYCPVVAVLSVLEAQVRRCSPQMTSQGVSLVLSSCATLKHTPERGTLACLSAAMRRSLAAFKRQELASSLEAFKAFNYHPGNELLKAIARQAGLTLSPAALQPESREVANNVVATGGSSRAASPLAAIRDCGAAAAAAERFLARQATSGTLAAVTAREMQRRAGEVVQSMREGLTQGLGSTVNDWMYEFGERKTPEPSLLSQRLDSWRFGKGGVSGPQVNV
ncbi:hypothetical protein WJX75_005137 [Coccomyxa subellipsoidea]|uniref:Uncharacterized protein n=1 Tax=Coccomyxa subellipsoidea TaxID=248742 RepID=A0ABR2YRS4_9CHLO